VHILFRGCMYHVGCFSTQEQGAAARDMFLLRNATEKELQTRKLNYPERVEEFRKLIERKDSPETGIAKTVTPVKQRSRKQRLAAKKAKEEQLLKEKVAVTRKERRKRRELKQLKLSLSENSEDEDEEEAQDMTTEESEEPAKVGVAKTQKAKKQKVTKKQKKRTKGA